MMLRLLVLLALLLAGASASEAATIAVQPCSGGSCVSVNILPLDGSGYVQMSAAALPLPSGAASATNQTSQITEETAIVTGVGTPTDAASCAVTSSGSSLSACLHQLHLDAEAGVAAGQNATAPSTYVMMGAQFNTTPTTITSGNVSPLQLDSAGNLKVNVEVGGGGGGGGGAVTVADGADVTLGSKADAATCATTNTEMACLRQIDSDVKSAAGVYGSTLTITALDVSSLTGGTASTILSAGHRTKGGWIQNPLGATALCINENGTASGTTTSGSNICIAAGSVYQLAPSGNAVSAITASSGSIGGYGFQ